MQFSRELRDKVSSQTPAPSPAGQASTGGVADTPANPDSTYVCAAVATNSSGQTVGYLTVAGSDNAVAQSECSTVAQTSGWAAAGSSPFHEKPVHTGLLHHL